MILLDGEQVSAGVHYMLPGAHELVGRAPDGTRAVEQWSGVAGGSRRVTLRLIPEQTAVAVAAAGPTALPTGETRDRAAVQSERPNSLPNALFWAGGAGTVVLLGLTTWSGLEALSARDKLDSEPRAYDPNEVRQLAQRTDYFLVGTAILGVVTAAAGIWLVDWGPETRLALSPLPRGGAALAAEGHF